jgi:hypothetical protein
VCKQLLDNLTDSREYCSLKEIALDRTFCQRLRTNCKTDFVEMTNTVTGHEPWTAVGFLKRLPRRAPQPGVFGNGFSLCKKRTIVSYVSYGFD